MSSEQVYSCSRCIVTDKCLQRSLIWVFLQGLQVDWGLADITAAGCLSVGTILSPVLLSMPSQIDTEASTYNH